jgi:membrane protein DedA with SNARE-associated domain
MHRRAARRITPTDERGDPVGPSGYHPPAGIPPCRPAIPAAPIQGHDLVMMEWATNLVAEGGLLGVFLLMVAENLFPPIPSEVIMSLAGFTAAQGKLSLIGVILAGIAGAVVGNAVWYELARLFGAARTRALLTRFGRYVGLKAAEVEQAEAVMRRKGPVAVFVGRFMPGVRTAISVPAGLIELPRHVFYVWTTLGTAIWTSALAIAGFMLEEHFHLVERYAGPIGLGFLALGAVAVGWYLWQGWRARTPRPR